MGRAIPVLDEASVLVGDVQGLEGGGVSVQDGGHVLREEGPGRLGYLGQEVEGGVQPMLYPRPNRRAVVGLRALIKLL